MQRHLHKFDSRAIWIANINDAFPGIRSRLESLWFACSAPTGSCDFVQNRVKVINEQSNVNVSNIAWPKIDMFPIGRCEILKQFDFVSVTFQDRDQNLRARHAGYFAGERASLVRSVRKLKPENVTPEREGTLEIRDGNASVIHSNDAK